MSLKSQKPTLDLLLITIDTLRADRVSFYSDKHLKTANLDNLARESTAFTRAFANTSTTLPSHTNILLGSTPSYHGVHDNTNFVVRKEFFTLAEQLKGQGYSTGAFVGGFPLESRFGLNQGFDIYDDRFDRGEATPGSGGERRAQAVLESALGWLERRSSPWFLWIHFWDPHDPYDPPEPFKSQYAKNPYDGEVAYVDAILGNLFRFLEEHGLWQKTLVVFTGDHGESLGEHDEKTHGFLAYNTTLWIPLFIRVPGLAHRVVSQNVSHIDIFPTVCEILGLKKPSALQGSSLIPLMKGDKIAEEPIFFESLSAYYNMGWAPIKGYIHKEEKFIDSPLPEFYDLGKDFEERKNLLDSRTLPAQKKMLNQIIQSESSGEAEKAEQRMDRETLEKLKSLGYLASSPGVLKDKFTPGDDVKRMLPYHNKAMDGLDLYRSGKVREGIEALKEVITDKKNVSTAYLNLAFIYRSQGRPADATSVLKMGLAALPENYDIYSQYLTYLYEAGQVDEVIRVFETMRLPQTEFNPVIWNYAGLACWKKGDDKKAQEYYEKSLAIDEKFAIPYANLGNLHYFRFKRTTDAASYRKAVECYQKSIALDPAYSAAYHGLGVTYLQGGNTALAIVNLEKALELEPEVGKIFYFLWVSYLQAGNRDKACFYLMKFKSSPDYDSLSSQEKADLEKAIANCQKKS